jgi:8-oxo-dGTP diphosphatase
VDVTDQIVVGAAVLRATSSSTSAVLAARRRRPAELAGGWEFPGGKVEAGESDADALVRECREELGVDIEVGSLLATTPIRAGLTLRVYQARLVIGSAEPAAGADHDELRWLGTDELWSVAWLEPDRPAVRRLQLS